MFIRVTELIFFPFKNILGVILFTVKCTHAKCAVQWILTNAHTHVTHMPSRCRIFFISPEHSLIPLHSQHLPWKQPLFWFLSLQFNFACKSCCCDKTDRRIFFLTPFLCKPWSSAATVGLQLRGRTNKNTATGERWQQVAVPGRKEEELRRKSVPSTLVDCGRNELMESDEFSHMSWSHMGQRCQIEGGETLWYSLFSCQLPL